MQLVIKLLQERNKFLAKFSALNIAEMKRMLEGDFDRIDAFYATREGILDIIRQIELMLEKRLMQTGNFSDIPASVKKLVADLLKERDELIGQILNQDLEILTCIDKTKNSIIRELQTLRKNRKVISSYKSGKRESLVDEEA